MNSHLFFVRLVPGDHHPLAVLEIQETEGFALFVVPLHPLFGHTGAGRALADGEMIGGETGITAFPVA